jgi:hypothetical protein
MHHILNPVLRQEIQQLLLRTLVEVPYRAPDPTIGGEEKGTGPILAK